MHWRLKGAIQKLLGLVPNGEHVHYLLQRRFGELGQLEVECASKVHDWSLMIGHLRAAKVAIAGSRFLEIGTGWYPTLPFCLYVAGAARVDTFDLNRYLKPDLARACAGLLGRMLDKLAEATGGPVEELRARQQSLQRALVRGASLEEATDGVVRYRAPGDASATGLPSASFDVVFSNSVLEHVPEATIAELFVEARRVLRPGGVNFHSVNCGDHYAYVDRSIGKLNYLRFSDAQWQKWNNKFLYQNRLRAMDFTRLARQAGFVIEVDTSRPNPDRLAELANLPVDPDFAARYPREQLAITSIDFVGRKQPEPVVVQPHVARLTAAALIDSLPSVVAGQPPCTSTPPAVTSTVRGVDHDQEHGSVDR